MIEKIKADKNDNFVSIFEKKHRRISNKPLLIHFVTKYVNNSMSKNFH